MVLIGAVATLAREIEKDSRFYKSMVAKNPEMMRSHSLGLTDKAIADFVNQEADAALEAEEEFSKLNMASPNAADAASAFVKTQNSQDAQSPLAASDGDGNIDPEGDFTASEQLAISEMLDAWEEPTRAEESLERKITIGAVMQFRQALTSMKRKYPFLPGE